MKRKEPFFLFNEVLAAIGNPTEGLDMGSFHSCQTTHCIAGWICVIAGKETERGPVCPAAERIVRALCPWLTLEGMQYEETPFRIWVFHTSASHAYAVLKKLAKFERTHKKGETFSLSKVMYGQN